MKYGVGTARRAGPEKGRAERLPYKELMERLKEMMGRVAF
jgi:hypothetical protein